MSKHCVGYVIYIYLNNYVGYVIYTYYIEYTIYIDYINNDFYNKSIRIFSIVVKKGFI